MMNQMTCGFATALTLTVCLAGCGGGGGEETCRYGGQTYKVGTTFDDTDGCNSCHQSMGRGFIIMQMPTASPFGDQRGVLHCTSGRFSCVTWTVWPVATAVASRFFTIKV